MTSRSPIPRPPRPVAALVAPGRRAGALRARRRARPGPRAAAGLHRLALPVARSGFRYADALALHEARPDTLFFSMYEMRDPFPAPVLPLAEFPRLAPALGRDGRLRRLPGVHGRRPRSAQRPRRRARADPGPRPVPRPRPSRHPRPRGPVPGGRLRGHGGRRRGRQAPRRGGGPGVLLVSGGARARARRVGDRARDPRHRVLRAGTAGLRGAPARAALRSRREAAQGARGGARRAPAARR